MSVPQVTPSTFDGELNDDDLDPLFGLISVMAFVAEDFTDWYTQTASNLETASGWFNWFGESFDGTSLESDALDSEVTGFTSWMNQIGFNYTKYFNTNDDATEVTGINGDYKNSEIGELLALEVEAISSDADQASLLTTGLIGDFNDGTEELINLIDTLRSAWRGHIRS